MLSKTLTIENSEGLHMRPAGVVAKVINGSLPFTPMVEYSNEFERLNIKEYETDKKM